MLHNLILRFLLGPAMLGFAAGAAAITDMGGGDAGVVDAGAEVTDSGAEVTDAGDGSEVVEAQGESGEGEVVEGQETQQTSGEEKIDWRTVPQDVRNHLQEIKKTNPALANKLQNAVYTSQTILKAVPGGLKEIQALKQAVEEAGGTEEIQSMRQTHRAMVEEQEDLDRRAAAGDVSVLDNLIEVAGQDGFGKLMPAAIDKWAQKNPAEYNYAMGQVVIGALQEGGVVNNLNMAIKMFQLGTPESIKLGNESLQGVVDHLNNIHKMATTAPEKPKVDPKIAEQQQQIDSDRTKIFNDRFSDRFSSWRNPEISRQLSELGKGRQFTDYQRGAFFSGVIEELKRVLTSDEDYTRNLERVYNTRNIDDLFKFTKSRSEKLIPEAAKKVFRELFTQATLGAKKPPVQQKPNATAKPGAAQPAAKGWVKVANGPKPDEIDREKSDFKMIALRKAAILKDGRRVFWGDKAPA